MPDDDWMLAQGTVDFRNEEIRHRHGTDTGVDTAAWLSDDPELGLVNADMGEWADAHPCTCGPDTGLHAEECPQS